MRNFRTYNIAVRFYRLATALPLPRHLREQLLRVSSSIALNLAEGAGRRTKGDQGRFFSIALGSLRECQAILELALQENDECKVCADMLGGNIYRLIESCRR